MSNKYYVGLNWEDKNPACVITSTPLPKLWAAFLSISNENPYRYFFTIEDIPPARFKQLATNLCELIRFDTTDRASLLAVKPMIVKMVDEYVKHFKRSDTNTPYLPTTITAA